MSIRKLTVGLLSTNSYLLFEEAEKQAIVIDPGGDGEKILSKISKLGLHVRYIVASHGHFDHILAVDQIKKQENGNFLLHKDDVGLLTRAQKMARYYGYREWTLPKPDGYIKDGEVLKASGTLNLQVLHTPGHSPGSISLFWEDEGKNQLFSGDLIFSGGVGRTDLQGGNLSAMKRSLKKIFKLPENTIIHPGHGSELSLQEAKEVQTFIRR
ncbi:MAG: MBL fold metallo-hydrolase [Candidatus Korarchaeota archaeon]|nr:MBL fold metallo-hydrolase [Candidatus Korarchaeota archaeon]NIU85394.1 MBL fold metallo-hydrolase [Candidatus Thorarchaeota archaeon]NIW15492.1 MBL fold metallo-hydrolase [Candidatus Thorarchaeota archaeon]NIW53436.1 MBL fold metallo-hydrolase [Candidatus Korarchaeota archaeon]